MLWKEEITPGSREGERGNSEGKSESKLQMLGVKSGTVVEFEEMKSFAAFLASDEEVLRWWRVGMGFVKREGDGDGEG